MRHSIIGYQSTRSNRKFYKTSGIDVMAIIRFFYQIPQYHIMVFK